MACKHGMNEAWCSLCNPPKLQVKRAPQHTKTKTVFGQDSISIQDLPDLGCVIIHTSRGRDHFSFSNLDNHTTMVHIDGCPFLWAIEKIINLAPNLKTIRVIPTMERKMLESHKKLCGAKGISIVTGHYRPELAWTEGENRSPHYQKQALFLRNIQGEQRQLLDELRFFGFEELEITSRYFCLNNEEYLPQRVIADQFDLNGRESEVSEQINAVLYYLDPTFEAGYVSRSRAYSMRHRIERLRMALKQTHDIVLLRQNLAENLDLPKLPDKMPLGKFGIFEALIKCSRTGKLDWLKTIDEKLYRVLVLRYGLNDYHYKTLKEVGDIEGLTKQRIDQLEEKALALLGIEEKTSPL